MVIRYRPVGGPETSVRNDYTLRNSPEERSSRLRPCGSLQSRMHTEVQFNCQSDEAFQCVSVPYSITTVLNVAVSLATLQNTRLRFIPLHFKNYLSIIRSLVY